MTQPELLGIEIGGTKLQAVLGTSSGEISESCQVAANAAGGASAILDQLQELIRQLIASSAERPCGMGIGFGGPVDSATGTVIKSNHVAGWEDLSLVEWAKQEFGLPCAVGNDTDTAAVAEATLGCRANDRCVFYTNIGSGIGGGLVMNGAVYARPKGAMEVGHHHVYSELEKRHGILEDFCSGWSLDRRAREAAQHDRDSLLWQTSNGNLKAINAKLLFSAWQQSDRAASAVVNDFLACYGRTMANVIALLNPDVVVIGGGVANVGLPLLSAIRSAVERHAYAPFARTYRVELTSLGERAVPTGALLLAAAL